jgi:competence protein ComEC
VLITIGYGAGLATGLSHLMAPVFVVAALLSLAIMLRKGPWWPLLPAAVIGTIAGLHAHSTAARHCAARLPLGEKSYHLRSIDPGEGSGRVLLIGAGCDGSVLARWPGTARFPAGVTMSVSARWVPAPGLLGRPDGMLLIRNADSARGIPTIIGRARTAIVQSTRALYGPRAPLANALVAGWRGEIDPVLRSAFASAGLMHLLAISGFHIAWLAGAALLALRLGGAPRHPAECAAALAALAYTAFLGWPAAALRASLLLLLAALCRWRQRQVRWGALLATSMLLVMILDPWAITEPGAWLSVLGLAGVVAAIRWSDRAIGSHWLVRSLTGSTGAMVATAPMAAAVFGQVAPVGIVLNLVGMPLLLLLLPAVFVPVLLHNLLPPVANAIAVSGNGLLALLELLARIGSHVPGNGSPGETGLVAAGPWLAVLVAAAWTIRGGTTLPEAVRRVAWSGVVALGMTLAAGHRRVIDVGDQALTLLFVDVGQGDAALLRTPAGHWIEVDAGPAGEGRDAGRQVIAPLLKSAGVPRVDLFVLSHAHRDHVGGGAGVLDQVRIDLAIEPGELFADSAYDGWLAALAGHHSRWRSARAGSHWTLDGVTFRVLHPPTPWARQGEDLNEDSIVLEVAYGDFRALLMGDAGFVAESAMGAALRPVNVLKVGHHGSRTATGEEFLAATRPQAAIVSVGRNHYGHPAPETLDRLGGAKVAVWRTDVDGTVRVTTDGRTFTVKGARTTATFGTTH